ncbi:FAD-dependent pyridine nucleotide-disulfide oxidoreductase OS=Tsukamurella paurometabola (strain ATCC 8368 / DSM / CCUG 35730 / CIP 100753 / JCM 10117 /KCTC 9821 / NBRC 16120 / NCIMB 702349 / NCTC 13040) OX=521096 GN=Tpau_3444 PE=4 SV=1 [Tsukamurella paurometabola]|uniref:FAD-dependent pyridine nucleotide-disulfide oxidoreductase n=1 Tax=Tsukamurella paurometabola (strain ATCC 8368 / DSM 20162 / CCUG 35730 / CIP 100753 / JCM 10117 / KCTC 9821 / NBRC 16120 / NCIMB 702349 / NCTC 13040) TaxID=521096 RepID=D5UX08_TSUPD|nr:NAD(P)/FAD-dependent oxidoreductase [Tsukamurella paurometabola]ADG80027.1 FAD-dependent pyridine nucleotide-disulfide oxidoreductase [Tsukamurella paurometabola DSM 20162]SUP38108.1 4-hydroxyacetophenone monooxygenase [Tsukamurella paurometabola]
MTHDVIIVGAGFGGMGAAIELGRMGIDDVVILEREDDLGGTWHVNHYPGLAVDIASVTYSYSFEPNPNWSRLYAPGSELKAYASHVADKYGLRPKMRFGVDVTGASWDAEASEWEVRIAGGEPLRTRYLVTATGFLSQPKLPDIEGIDDFAGTVIHSAKWDDEADLAGRRIGVIGTGATGVQLVPELAKVARQLTVFQRTPIWVVPKVDFAVPAPVRGLFGAAPFTQRLARLVNSAVLEVLSTVGVLNYKYGHRFNAMAAQLAKAHLRAQVPDKRIRAALTPDYSFGCKRPTFSNTYFPTFSRENVTLEPTTIRRVLPRGIEMDNGTVHEIDTLVLATGFSLWEKNFPAIDVTGRDGRNLGQWWRENRFQAYEGMAVPKFPNFFSLHSPYSYTGLSYFWTIEAQMVHLRRVLEEARTRGARTVEVTERANAEFLDTMSDRLGRSVFQLGSCEGSRSYYFDPHGEATLLRPSSVIGARRDARTFPIDDYAFN